MGLETLKEGATADDTLVAAMIVANLPYYQLILYGFSGVNGVEYMNKYGNRKPLRQTTVHRYLEPQKYETSEPLPETKPFAANHDGLLNGAKAQFRCVSTAK